MIKDSGLTLWGLKVFIDDAIQGWCLLPQELTEALIYVGNEFYKSFYVDEVVTIEEKDQENQE